MSDRKIDRRTDRQQTIFVENNGSWSEDTSVESTSVDNNRCAMPWGGLEPPCQLRHNALNVACLPISPPRLNFIYPLGTHIIILESPCIVKRFFWHLQNSSSGDSRFSFVRANGNNMAEGGKIQEDECMYIFAILKLVSWLVIWRKDQGLRVRCSPCLSPISLF